METKCRGNRNIVPFIDKPLQFTFDLLFKNLSKPSLHVMPKLTNKYSSGPQRVNVSTPVKDILFLLKRDGGVIIEKHVNQEVIDQAYTEILPRLEQDKPWDGKFFPGETRRAPGMNAYSPTFTGKMLMHPLYQSVVNHFLSTTNSFWWGEDRRTHVAKPQVSACTAFQVGPGAKDQQIHRDDYIFHNAHSEISEWNDERDLNGRESAVGVFVAGVKTTKANGATRFIPGSHLWGNEQKPNEEDCFYAELAPGDAFFMLASCYHGGSANTTKDEWRLVYGTFCTRGFLRQEENQYLTIPEEVIKAKDQSTQKLLGWGLSDPMMGWVNFEDPMKLLHPNDFKSGPTDLY
ncbi:hypothetical protein SLS56_004546 [Neofusicoccum ribis]|uniref:Phytanoyl-CoA dioxygenase n=1 Tax=Neofusicoccum ribis TaxID=45134 RepID=A0ABR3SWY3_9PEZI